MTQRIGIMGGMFDPVHNGHIQVALVARRTLALDHVRLVPCGIPNHRERALCSSLQRLDMLRLATADCEGLDVDDRELNRPGTSYTYDTVASIREEFRNAILFLILGVDAFAGLASWHRWREIFDLCHFVVISRPGAVVAAGSAVGEELARRRVHAVTRLDERANGLIFQIEEPAISISSTQVRDRISRSEDLDDLVPPLVADYLGRHKLYTRAVTGP